MKGAGDVDNFKGNDGRLRELALFAGAGGGILGGRLLGWRTICAVEINEYCREVLVRRQNEGHLEPFPVWDDVCTFDGRPWKGRVDVISGGFPCQDISSAGRGAGIEGAKSSLWGHMARIISEVLPEYVFVENSPLLVQRGLAVVISDLAQMGYDARWGIVGADNAGAPHRRKRIWILAHTCQERLERACDQKKPDKKGWEKQNGFTAKCRVSWWNADPAEEGKTLEPPVGRLADGVAYRMDRLQALGNGQVPAVVALAWNLLMNLE